MSSLFIMVKGIKKIENDVAVLFVRRGERSVRPYTVLVSKKKTARHIYMPSHFVSPRATVNNDQRLERLITQHLFT